MIVDSIMQLVCLFWCEFSIDASRPTLGIFKYDCADGNLNLQPLYQIKSAIAKLFVSRSKSGKVKPRSGVRRSQHSIPIRVSASHIAYYGYSLYQTDVRL